MPCALAYGQPSRLFSNSPLQLLQRKSETQFHPFPKKPYLLLMTEDAPELQPLWEYLLLIDTDQPHM